MPAQEDFFENSDDEGAKRDHYAEKLKKEAKEREEEDDVDEESDESGKASFDIEHGFPYEVGFVF